MALKINPEKYNWPQKTCKLLKNKFPGSKWSVILMQIKQSEVYDKILVTELGVLVVYRVGNLPIEKLYMIKNF